MKAALRILALSMFGLGACSSLPEAVPLIGEEPAVDIEGSRAFSKRQLRQAAVDDLTDFEQRGYAKAALDDAAFSVERHYRRSGYPKARVDYELLGEDARPVAKLLVNEGPFVRVGQVTLTGSELKRDTWRPFFPERGAPFVESEMRASAGRLAAYQYSLGHLSAEAGSPTIDFDLENGRAHVSVELTLGPRSVLHSVELEAVADPLDEALRARLERLARQSLTQAFTPRRAVEIGARLREFLGARGHLDAKVTRLEEESNTDHTSVTRTDAEVPNATEPGTQSLDSAPAGDQEVNLTFSVDPGPRSACRSDPDRS